MMPESGFCFSPGVIGAIGPVSSCCSSGSPSAGAAGSGAAGAAAGATVGTTLASVCSTIGTIVQVGLTCHFSQELKKVCASQTRSEPLTQPRNPRQPKQAQIHPKSPPSFEAAASGWMRCAKSTTCLDRELLHCVHMSLLHDNSTPRQLFAWPMYRQPCSCRDRPALLSS